MKKLYAGLLLILGTIAALAAISALFRLLGVPSIADDHARKVAIVEHTTGLLFGGAIAYFAIRRGRRLNRNT